MDCDVVLNKLATYAVRTDRLRAWPGIRLESLFDCTVRGRVLQVMRNQILSGATMTSIRRVQSTPSLSWSSAGAILHVRRFRIQRSIVLTHSLVLLSFKMPTLTLLNILVSTPTSTVRAIPVGPAMVGTGAAKAIWGFGKTSGAASVFKTSTVLVSVLYIADAPGSPELR